MRRRNRSELFETNPITTQEAASLLVILGLLCAAAIGCTPGDSSEAPTEAETRPAPDAGVAVEAPRRVVLIVIDSLRPDHLATHGYDRNTAPFLGQIADSGSVFDYAHSTSSWTAPAVASLMTGLYPTRHGVLEGFFAHRDRERLPKIDGKPVQSLPRLPRDVPTLTERLAAAGYRARGFSNNLNVSPVIGFDRGVENFSDAHTRPASGLAAQARTWPPAGAESEERSFIYLHLSDAHFPYSPRSRWYQPDEAGAEIAAYDSEIGYIDHQLSKLGEALGWNEDTLIIVVSDHGQAFGEHGGRRHDGGLHGELTRVVLFMSGPGVPRTRIDVDVSLVDVVPTVIEICGLPSDDVADLDGRSLVPLMRAAAVGDDGVRDAFGERPLLVHRAKMGARLGEHWWALVMDGWKLMVDGESRALYDIRSDPGETSDRLAAEPARARALSAELDALRAGGFRALDERIDFVVDDEMHALLEQLGYVEGPEEDEAAAPQATRANGHDAG